MNFGIKSLYFIVWSRIFMYHRKCIKKLGLKDLRINRKKIKNNKKKFIWGKKCFFFESLNCSLQGKKETIKQED